MAEAQDQEQAPAGRLATGLDPIGAALRATYDADNHDSLGSDLTGLMLELTHVNEPVALPKLVPVIPPRPSWFQWMLRQARR